MLRALLFIRLKRRHCRQLNRLAFGPNSCPESKARGVHCRSVVLGPKAVRGSYFQGSPFCFHGALPATAKCPSQGGTGCSPSGPCCFALLQSKAKPHLMVHVSVESFWTGKSCLALSLCATREGVLLSGCCVPRPGGRVYFAGRAPLSGRGQGVPATGVATGP